LNHPKKKKRIISVQDGWGCAGSNERQVENSRITEIALFTWPPFSKLVLEVKQLKLNEELGFQIAKNGNRETLEIKRSSYRSNSQNHSIYKAIPQSKTRMKPLKSKRKKSKNQQQKSKNHE